MCIRDSSDGHSLLPRRFGRPPSVARTPRERHTAPRTMVAAERTLRKDVSASRCDLQSIATIVESTECRSDRTIRSHNTTVARQSRSGRLPAHITLEEGQMKRYTWIIVLTALSLVAAACGTDESTDTTAEATTTTAGATTTAAGTDTTESPDTTQGETGEEEPILFASSLPLTGEFSVTGTKHRDGYQFCVDEINARGGILGREVELLVEDNRSDTEATVNQMERFINVENADVLLGTFSSLLGFPASTVAEQNGM